MQTDDVRVDDEGRRVPAYSLYPVKGVTWATLMGSPFAGGIIMAINYGRLGHDSAKWHALLWSLLGTAALLTALFFIPEDLPIPNAVFILPQVAVMYSVAKSLQGAAIDAHQERGGALASVWRAVGIGLLCCLFIVGVAFGVGYLTLPYELDSVVEFNTSDEVYYSGEATREDATFVGELLTQYEFFGHSTGASVQVAASSGAYTLSFVLVDDAWDDPEIVDYFLDLAGLLADTRFGRPLRVNLCDEYLKSHRSLRID